VQGLPSSQLTGDPGVHVPALQSSAPLQALPSEHDVPLVLTVKTQPVAGTQEFVVHGLPSSHPNGAGAGAHTPAEQLSAPLHRLPSEQLVPSTIGVKTQPPLTGLQELVVQGLLSSHTTGVPEDEQVPLEQVSVPSHRSASAQDAPLGRLFCTQPHCGSQTATVQGLLSAAQVSGVPPVEQRPF